MTDFLEDMVADMKECVAIAHKAGVPDDKIMLDPGVGFGKTYEQNLEAINHVDVLQELGLPILLGTSRKSDTFSTWQSEVCCSFSTASFRYFSLSPILEPSAI